MKFGPVPPADAVGAILAHSLGVGGKRLKKGRILTQADARALADAGINAVTVARPDPGDILEDEAAQRIAAAILKGASGVSGSAPFTGRANIFADHDGLFSVDADLVHALNAIDEAITFATLPDMTRVTHRQMLGTVKIIPYGVSAAAVERAEALVGKTAMLRCAPFRVRSARLILTRTPGMKESLLTKGADAVRHRLAGVGISDLTEVITNHRVDELAPAIAGSRADLTLILTGSATSDRQDVGPAAVQAAGGRIMRFGMPVDPGNLLFLGQAQGRPVLGLPGCARSPKLNGADWVLERLAAGLDVPSEDIAAMGVGGLLKEIPSRPEPRVGGATVARRPVIGAVLLGAGGSTRMRGRDKLLEEVDGAPLIATMARRLQASGVDQVVCVLPPDRPDRNAALAGLDVTVQINPRTEEGMATSIAAGLSALAPGTDAVLIVLGDMPEVMPADIRRLLAAFDPEEGRAIVRATAPDGTPGQPVLFGRRFFEALGQLTGDTGAREIVRDHGDFVVDVALDGDRALLDLDTPEAWGQWRAKQGS